MATREEIERLAAAANSLRPDWPVKSLITYLMKNHETRPYKDLGVALVWIATDSTTVNPARLSEAGPWWSATRASTLKPTPRVGPEPGAERCRYAGHEHEDAERCRLCAAERAAGDVPAERADPVPPPLAIVAVANRHRIKAGSGVSSARDFAQAEELREPDPFGVKRCTRCQGYFVDDPAGVAAHVAVFSHTPIEAPPQGPLQPLHGLAPEPEPEGDQ